MSEEKVKQGIVLSAGDNDKRGYLIVKNTDKRVLYGNFRNKIFEIGI